MSNDTRGVACHNRARRHIACDDSTCADDGSSTNILAARQDNRAHPDPRVNELADQWEPLFKEFSRRNSQVAANWFRYFEIVEQGGSAARRLLRETLIAELTLAADIDRAYIRSLMNIYHPKDPVRAIIAARLQRNELLTELFSLEMAVEQGQKVAAPAALKRMEGNLRRMSDVVGRLDRNTRELLDKTIATAPRKNVNQTRQHYLARSFEEYLELVSVERELITTYQVVIDELRADGTSLAASPMSILDATQESELLERRASILDRAKEHRSASKGVIDLD